MVVTAVLIWQATIGPGPDLRAELSAPDTDARMVITARSDDPALDVDLASAAPEAGRVYELWLLPEGAAPISLGTFAGDAQLRVDPALSLVAGTQLAVSVEPVGGSPTGAPTGPVIAAGVLIDA